MGFEFPVKNHDGVIGDGTANQYRHGRNFPNKTTLYLPPLDGPTARRKCASGLDADLLNLVNLCCTSLRSKARRAPQVQRSKEANSETRQTHRKMRTQSLRSTGLSKSDDSGITRKSNMNRILFGSLTHRPHCGTSSYSERHFLRAVSARAIAAIHPLPSFFAAVGKTTSRNLRRIPSPHEFLRLSFETHVEFRRRT